MFNLTLLLIVLASSSAQGAVDTNRDAEARIATAIRLAAVDNIRVLITWSAKDDKSSQALEGARRSQDLTELFANEYKVVNVDVGQIDNVELARSYGVTPTPAALPALTVLDKAGAIVTRAAGAAFRSDVGGGYDAAKLAAFLLKYTAPPPADAQVLLDAALSQGRKEGKSVLVWFSTPSCGWCHRLGAWMALAEVTPTLGAEFVTLKIDYDRSKGTRELERRYVTAEQGLPWFMFLDGSGQALMTSIGPKGNIGMPWQPHEVAYFRKMLEGGTKRLTAQQIAALITSLEEFSKRDR